jgi:hypothetical protein
MAFEIREGQGALFKNQRKTEDRQPDYTGEAKLNGEMYWISAWIKEGKSGKFMSFSIQSKQDAPRQQGAVSAQIPDDDVPF